MLYLVRKKLTEVLHVHLVSLCIYHCGKSVEFDLVVVKILYRDDYIGQLSDSGRLYENAIRIVLLDYLIQRPAEISDERAADASGYHLVDLYAGFSEEACVDSDLAEFVLDKYYVFVFISFRYEFFNKCSFACSEESGENIYFCHLFCLSVLDIISHFFRIDYNTSFPTQVKS